MEGSEVMGLKKKRLRLTGELNGRRYVPLWRIWHNQLVNICWAVATIL